MKPKYIFQNLVSVARQLLPLNATLDNDCCVQTDNKNLVFCQPAKRFLFLNHRTTSQLASCTFNPQIKTCQSACFCYALFFFVTFFTVSKCLFSTTINTGSSAVIQEIGIITAGSSNQPILKIKIVTTGGGTAASICGMQFTMNNTVNGDVSFARLFYTSTTDAFSTTTQVGATVSNPTSTISFSFTQNHGSGTFYYWLAFDIVSCVPDCHYFDAFVPTNGITYVNASTTCTGTSTFTPLTPDPAGSKRTYCECSDCWNQRANFGGVIRYAAAAFVIGSKAYVGTGAQGSSGPFFKDIWEYNQITNIWTQKADLGGAERESPAAFSINGKGYISCGSGGAGTTRFKDTWEYDPVGNNWIQKADLPGVARNYPAAFVVGTKAYVGTGYSASASLNDFYEYDPSGNTWTQIANFAGGIRSNTTSFSIGSKGYVGCGYKLENPPASYATIFEYNPSTNTWTNIADFGGGTRLNMPGFSINGLGYSGTGLNDSPGQLTKDFWEYNSSTNTWIQKSDFPPGNRDYTVGFTIGQKGYIGTGRGPDGSTWNNDLWEYTATGSGATNSITTSAIPQTTLCRGQIITVNYSVSGTYYSGNTFTAQLSDATGSFASPTIMGNVTSTTAIPIVYTIPSEHPMGTLYRIRVISSCPSIIGSDNGSNLTVPGNCTFYWVGGAGNWNDATHWSISSGGSGGDGTPNIHINVIIDDNSGTSGSVPISMPIGMFYTKQFTMSGVNGSRTPLIGQGSLLPRPNSAD